MSNETNMKELMEEIHQATAKQRSANQVDEVRVMKTMINDPSFTVGIYNRNKGYVGQRCPHDEFVKFIGDVTSSISGLEPKHTAELANSYEATKSDASFLVNNAKDFVSTYLQTGRKLPLVQSEDSEAALLLREIESKEKQCPDGSSTVVPSFNKVVCKSRCPKYIGQQHE